jgi:ketosteroid isomerase-like protein
MQKQILLLLVFCSSFVYAQTKNSDIQIVLQQMKIQEDAWNNGKIPEFMNYYWKSDSLKFIGKKGITYGWQQTLDNYLKSYPDKTAMGILKFSIKEATQLSPESIYIIGSWDLQREKPVGGYFTLLWKKIDGKWVIVADHTS